MSKHDERRARFEAFERDQAAAMNARPNVAPIEKDPDPSSWTSLCTGWRGGFHERPRGNAMSDPIWRCRWCGRRFTPPLVPNAVQVRPGVYVSRSSSSIFSPTDPHREGQK